MLSVPMQVFTVTLLTPLPRDSTAPAWAPSHLATSVSILALAGCIYSPRTWRSSQGRVCLPAASTSSAPSFLFKLPSQDLAPGLPVQFPWASAGAQV